MGKSGNWISELWSTFLKQVWGYEPSERELEGPRKVNKALWTLAVSILLSAWMASRFGGLCDPKLMYAAILLDCAGLIIALFMVYRGWLLLLVLIVGIGGLAWDFKTAAAAKNDLTISDLDVRTGLSEGVVTKVERYWVVDTDYYSSDLDPQSCTVYFSYSVSTMDYAQCDIVLKPKMKVGDRVKVLYSLSHPQFARMVKPDESVSP